MDGKLGDFHRPFVYLVVLPSPGAGVGGWAEKWGRSLCTELADLRIETFPQEANWDRV